jgi:ankyrin repeat protein
MQYPNESLENGSLDDQLFRAFKSNNRTLFHKLVIKGANINAVHKWRNLVKGTSNSSTLLTEAAYFNSVENIGTLLDYGADFNLPNDKGMTPLMFAATRGNIKATKWLVEAGAQVNIRDKLDMTAVMFAASFGSMDVVKYLTLNGADLGAKNVYGDTAYDIAQRKHRHDVANFISSEDKLDLIATLTKQLGDCIKELGDYKKKYEVQKRELETKHEYVTFLERKITESIFSPRDLSESSEDKDVDDMLSMCIYSD